MPGLCLAIIPSGCKLVLVLKSGTVSKESPRMERIGSVSTIHSENSTERVSRDRLAHFSLGSSSTLTREVRSRSSCCQIVAMMPATESWYRHNPAARFGPICRLTTGWRSLGQREMGAVLTIVVDVFIHEAFHVPPIENDHMVKQITSASADPTLGNAVLPRTSEAGALGLNAEILYSFDNFIVELRAAFAGRSGCDTTLSLSNRLGNGEGGWHAHG